MTRIDHVAEACVLAIQADAFTSSDMVLQTGEVKADVIAAAQLHATLALVEQQRIANLIALPPLDAYTTLYSGEHLHPDIAAALGVEAAS